MTHSCEKYLRNGPRAGSGEGEGESGIDTIVNTFDYGRACRNCVIFSLHIDIGKIGHVLTMGLSWSMVFWH